MSMPMPVPVPVPARKRKLGPNETDAPTDQSADSLVAADLLLCPVMSAPAVACDTSTATKNEAASPWWHNSYAVPFVKTPVAASVVLGAPTESKSAALPSMDGDDTSWLGLLAGTDDTERVVAALSMHPTQPLVLPSSPQSPQSPLPYPTPSPPSEPTTVQPSLLCPSTSSVAAPVPLSMPALGMDDINTVFVELGLAL